MVKAFCQEDAALKMSRLRIKNYYSGLRCSSECSLSSCGSSSLRSSPVTESSMCDFETKENRVRRIGGIYRHLSALSGTCPSPTTSSSSPSNSTISSIENSVNLKYLILDPELAL
ncbi:hypothetical protein DIPPA_22673 [Diplonema papillatum]|nr:hypothetical protein DIPPA_22673 [Diplonema papillatum]